MPTRQKNKLIAYVISILLGTLVTQPLTAVPTSVQFVGKNILIVSDRHKNTNNDSSDEDSGDGNSDCYEDTNDGCSDYDEDAGVGNTYFDEYPPRLQQRLLRSS